MIGDVEIDEPVHARRYTPESCFRQAIMDSASPWPLCPVSAKFTAWDRVVRGIILAIPREMRFYALRMG